MHAIFAYIGVVWGANVGKYGIHGASGYYTSKKRTLRSGLLAILRTEHGSLLVAKGIATNVTRKLLGWRGGLGVV